MIALCWKDDFSFVENATALSLCRVKRNPSVCCCRVCEIKYVKNIMDQVYDGNKLITRHSIHNYVDSFYLDWVLVNSSKLPDSVCSHFHFLHIICFYLLPHLA